MIESLSRPRFVLRVGVTGHRDRPGLGSAALLEAVRQTLGQLKRIAQEAFEQNRKLFDSQQEQPVLRLVCSLAKGADRLVAREALRKGYELHAILPFPREVYVQDPHLGSIQDFQELLEAAGKSVFELGNSCLDDKRKRDEAYEAAGRLVLRQSDVLIAVWDGEPEQGVGGTGQIVREARAAGIPTLHVSTEDTHHISLLDPSRASLSRGTDERPRDLKELLRERLLQAGLTENQRRSLMPPLIVRAFPVLTGKEEDIRKLAAEMAGARSKEAQEFFRHFGVVRESWHYQETPAGPMVIGVTELEEPDAKAREYAESNRPFDRWFKDQVRNLTGVDPDTQPLGPPSEVIFDTRGEEASYRKAP